MCLYVASELKTAKKDFYTLKVAEYVTKKNCKSFFQGQYQEYGRLLTEHKFDEFWDNQNPDFGMVYGFHSFVKTPTLVQMDFNLTCDYRGVILCKIPKGSKYYLGKYSDVISNQLELIEPICVSDNFLEEKVRISTVLGALKHSRKVCESYGINMIPS